MSVRAVSNVTTPFQDSGSIDLRWFDIVSEDQIRAWIRSYFFATPREDSPSHLIIGILNRLPTGSSPRHRITRQIASILTAYPAALTEPPENTATQIHGTGELLTVCVACKIAESQQWFLTQLKNIIFNTAPVWPDVLITSVIIAAASQTPAASGGVAADRWEALLRDSRYTTAALLAFGESFPQRVQRLDTWWATCPRTVRSKKLVGIIGSGLRECRVDIAAKSLREAQRDWDLDLKDAINEIFIGRSLLPPFCPPEPTSTSTAEEWTHFFLSSSVEGYRKRTEDPLQHPNFKDLISSHTIELIHNPEYPDSKVLRTFFGMTSDYIEKMLSVQGMNAIEATTKAFAEARGEVKTERAAVVFCFNFYLTRDKRIQEHT